MKVNFKHRLFFVVISLAVVVAYSIFNAKFAKPDLYDFTDKILKSTSVFQPCDKESIPSINVQISDNENVHINGVASKVTFIERYPAKNISVKCAGEQINSARLVHTNSYDMVISEGRTGLFISDLTHVQDNEVISGTWFFKKRAKQ